MKLSILELKGKLDALRVRHGHCVERSELEALLKHHTSNVHRRPMPARPSPLRRPESSTNNYYLVLGAAFLAYWSVCRVVGPPLFFLAQQKDGTQRSYIFNTNLHTTTAQGPFRLDQR